MYTEWEEFELNCRKCTACDLADTRKNVVIGRGAHSAKVLFVGEGPGEQEDIQGLPFVGPAGQLLSMVLEACRFSKDEYYIANIVKCRPPFNRAPNANEVRACVEHLRNQFMLIKPEVIVCLGSVAVKSLIDPNSQITKIRGQWIERKNIRFMSTFHPAAVLHDKDGGNIKKKYIFDDIMKVKEYLLENV